MCPEPAEEESIVELLENRGATGVVKKLKSLA